MCAEDDTMKSASEIQELFVSKGVDITKPMVMTCGAGIMASLVYANAKKAGFSGALYLYDGSFSEYKARSSQE